LTNSTHEGRYFLTACRVETRRWLVQKDDYGVMYQRLCQFYPLQHPCGILADGMVTLLVQPYVQQDIHRVGPGEGRGNPETWAMQKVDTTKHQYVGANFKEEITSESGFRITGANSLDILAGSLLREGGPMDSNVTLREVTRATFREILSLKVRPDQEQFVAPNAWSIAEAYFAEDAWFRGIYAGDKPVGFLMISDMPEKAEYFLWRLMIDARYQKSNYGRLAMELLIDHVRTRPNAEELYVSYHGGEGGPEGFYQKFGFEHTGDIEDGEILAKMKL